MALTITSPAFPDGGEIPTQYTCEGADLSPPLAFAGAPAGTRSLALLVDDPDAPDPRAPRLVFVHWVLWDMPPGAAGLPEGASPRALPAGTRAGLTDYRRAAWGGPCPPIGRHRYFFRLYALDALLGDLGSGQKARLLEAMKGHVLAEAQLVGTYQKKRG
ncbi:MAG TPA: YbhB/YbcL family Raf kinase inhibitor-like protein [Anaeromyxobacter sp.]|nr:YbhB/YbcL family Raf kinase inhibitor-like protein [Anaeromyxobacter sp.]